MPDKPPDQIVYVEEQWIEKNGAVYHRTRFDGDEWGEWEITFWDHLPWVLIKLQELRSNERREAS